MFFRLTSHIAILSILLTPTFSHPTLRSIFPSFITPRQSKALPGSCPSTTFPTESQYTLGYQTFCNTYNPHALDEPHPLIATIILKDFYNNPLNWVYSITLDDGVATGSQQHRITVTTQMCLEIFKRIVEGDEVGELVPGRSGGGVLGTNYCVVDGTGGDRKDGRLGMSGEGEVLVLGGSVALSAQKEGWGLGTERLYFETRERKGG